MKNNNLMSSLFVLIFVLSFNATSFSQESNPTSDKFYESSFFDRFFFDTKSLFDNIEKCCPEFNEGFFKITTKMDESEEDFTVYINGLDDFDKENINIDIDLENLILIIEASLEEAIILGTTEEESKLETNQMKKSSNDSKDDTDSSEELTNKNVQSNLERDEPSKKNCFFSYQIALPKDIDFDKEIETSFENGKLKLFFTKSEKIKTKRISLKI